MIRLAHVLLYEALLAKYGRDKALIELETLSEKLDVIMGYQHGSQTRAAKQVQKPNA